MKGKEGMYPFLTRARLDHLHLTFGVFSAHIPAVVVWWFGDEEANVCLHRRRGLAGIRGMRGSMLFLQCHDEERLQCARDEGLEKRTGIVR